MKGNDNYLPYQTPNSPYIAQPDATYVDQTKWKRFDYSQQKTIPELLLDFENNKTIPKWNNLKKEQIIKRLRKIVIDRKGLYQGPYSLCGPAAFFYCLINTDINKFIILVKELFLYGNSQIGVLKIRSSENLLNYNYEEIKQSFKKLYPKEVFPEQLDWMLMATLKDMDTFGYDPGTTGNDSDYIEKTRGITLAGTMESWLSETNLFKMVSNDTNYILSKSIKHFTNLSKDNLNVLLINSAMLKNHKDKVSIPNHWVVLKKNTSISKLSAGVKYTIWSWDEFYPLNSNLIVPFDIIEDNYYGAIICK